MFSFGKKLSGFIQNMAFFSSFVKLKKILAVASEVLPKHEA